MGKFFLGKGSFLFFFFWIEYFGMIILWTSRWLANFVLQNLKSWGRLQILKGIWEYCLRRLRTSLMKRAFKLFSKLYWIRIVMSTKISSYSFICQSGFGILRALSIFQALVKWFWHLTTSPSLLALRLGSERIMVNGFLTSKEISKVVIYNYVFCWL